MSWDGERPIVDGTVEKCATCRYFKEHPESTVGWCALGDDWTDEDNREECWEER